MEMNKITMAVVAVIVSVLMVSIATGVVSDAVKGDERAMTNSAVMNVDELGQADWTMSVNAAGTEILINGVSETKGHIFWLSDKMFMYADSTLHIIVLHEGSASVNAYTFGTNAVTVSATGGTVTVTVDGTVTATETYEWAYTYKAGGKYVYGFFSSTQPYVNGLDDVTAFSAGNRYLYHKGEFYYVGVPSEGAEYTWNLTETDSEDVQILSTSTVAYNSDTATFAIYVAPSKAVYYVNPIEGPEATMLNVIPVLLAVSIILGVIGMLYLRRD